MLLTVLRFNFASPQGEPRTQGQLISAALELAQWGESRGITSVSVDEHHVTGHGWSCNPIMAAAMFLARTERLIASVDCALGPLWNPVRLAEDIALVDNMSRGRLHTTVGLGYRAVEYDSLGLDFSRRGKLMDSLIERIDKEPAARPWGLWMLGAMAGRGVEPVRALTVLVQYAHDPDETTRYWAVAGMALVGSDPTVQLLLEIFHDDPSPRVRETAGCGLAQAGMLTREQRRRAAPELVRYAGDASLDANTRTWVYQALHDITGANVANDPVAWREWLAENGSN